MLTISKPVTQIVICCSTSQKRPTIPIYSTTMFVFLNLCHLGGQLRLHRLSCPCAGSAHQNLHERGNLALRKPRKHRYHSLLRILSSLFFPAGRQRSHDASLRLHSHLDGLVQLAPGSLGSLPESPRAFGERYVSLAAPLPAVLRQFAAERPSFRRRASADLRHDLRAARRRERILRAVPGSRRVSPFPRRSTTRTSSCTPVW